jgi:type I restriction enzyme, S subunit
MTWPAVRLDDVCEKITDGTHHSPANSSAGDFKYVTAKNIKPWGLDLTDVTYVDGNTHREIYSRCDVRKNDVLYVKDGATTGRVALNTLDEEFSLLSSVGVLRPSEKVKPKYLAYALQAPAVLDRMLGDMAGVAIRRLTIRKLKESTIPLAPLEKQGEIVAEVETQFSRLDEAVANLQRVRANLKRYESSILKAAFDGSLVEGEASIARREARSYESGARALQRAIQTGEARQRKPRSDHHRIEVRGDDLPALPEGWAWAHLADIAALKGGITVDSKRVDSTATLVPYLRVANVQRGYLDLSELKQINAPAAEVSTLKLHHGDVLFNEGGDRDKLGRGWIWEEQVPDCIHQNHVFRARLFLKEFSPKLVSWWGNTFGKEYFLRHGKQTTNLASINLARLSEFPVPIPPLAEQPRIVAEVDRRLSIVRELESEVDANFKRAQGLRAAILSRAFSP